MALLIEALRAPPAEGTLRLEPLAEAHRAALKLVCAEDLDIWQIYSVSYAPDHFDENFDRLLGGASLPFAIVDGPSLAGLSAYLNIDPGRQVVEIGNTYLRPATRGTGLNDRLKRLMIGHAFASGVRRIEFRVDNRNERSKAAVAKIGGIFEGLLRADRVTWTGHVRDTALFSILETEWGLA